MLNDVVAVAETSYFVLDTERDLVHFFRTARDNKPFQTLPLAYGRIDLNVDSYIVDEQTCQQQPAFKFQFMTNKGKKKKPKGK